MASYQSVPPTSQTISCPRCSTPTSLTNIRCPNCGVNLALAVARAAMEKGSAGAGEIGLPYEADRPLPRFGEFLLENGDITKAQLEAALARQTAVPGQHRTIGQILLEMGAVNREQLDRASFTQVRQFQTALQESREQLASHGKRIQQMEEALAEITELNLNTSRLVADVSQHLRTLVVRLNSDLGSADESSRIVLAEIEEWINKLDQVASGDV